MRRIAEGDDWGFAPVLRPDNLFPKQFPARISYQSRDRVGRFLRDRLEVVVGTHSIAQHYYRFGFPFDKKYLKISDFIGVAVETYDMALPQDHEETEGDGETEFTDGTISVSLYLLHENREHDILLYQENHDDDIVALWQFWSKRLKLPMLSVNPDGEITEPFELMGMVAKGESSPRPAHVYLNGRKPIFLRVRDMGSDGEPKRMHGRELMSRE